MLFSFFEELQYKFKIFTIFSWEPIPEMSGTASWPQVLTEDLRAVRENKEISYNLLMRRPGLKNEKGYASQHIDIKYSQ